MTKTCIVSGSCLLKQAFLMVLIRNNKTAQIKMIPMGQGAMTGVICWS